MMQLLDTSELAPPEPMMRVVDTLADMPEGDWLRVTHSREPKPLYLVLRQMHYCWQTVRRDDGRYEVDIWPESWGSHPPNDSC